MKIGILQTGTSPEQIRETSGDYNELFETLLRGRGLSFETYRVLDGQLPSDAFCADGWLITGSRFGVYEDHAWIAPLEALIRDVFTSDRPLVGVCFGHQIIAQAMGGHVKKYPGGWAVGPKVYHGTAGQEFRMNAWHQDQVIARPATATLIASNATCENAILSYGNTALTFQAHPEFSPAFMQALLIARGEVLPSDVRKVASRDIQETGHLDNMADHIEAFLIRRKMGL